MEIDAAHIDHKLFNVADYPMLSGLAARWTSAIRLDGRACRYLYSTAQETIDPRLLSAHEIELTEKLGIHFEINENS